MSRMFNDVVEFITGIEGTYGEYAVEYIKKSVKWYVEKRWKPEQLDDVFKQITFTYSTVYKTPPDVPKLREIFETKVNYESQAEKAWELVESVKTNAYPVLFEDSKIQRVIKNNWQTWDEFYLAKMDTEKRVFVKRDFIKDYILQCEINGKAEPELLRGYKLCTTTEDIIYIGVLENKERLLASIERLQIVALPEGVKQIADITKNIMAGVKA